MKKLIISAGLILAFGVYTFHSKFDKGEHGRLTKPASLSSSTDSTNTIANNTNTTPAPTQTTTQPNTTTTPKPAPTPAPTPAPPPVTKPKGQYNDGSYVGSVQDAFYGLVQVKAVISGGKITNVVWLQYPNDQSTSREINAQADPWLTQEAIAAQSANVDVVSGATQSSEAFIRSLTTALTAAKA